MVYCVDQGVKTDSVTTENSRKKANKEKAKIKKEPDVIDTPVADTKATKGKTYWFATHSYQENVYRGTGLSCNITVLCIKYFISLQKSNPLCSVEKHQWTGFAPSKKR